MIATHRMSKTVEYRAWLSAKARCFNPRDPHFYLYGGRGIHMCAEWDASFEAFYAHLGPRPSDGHSVDRIDVNGHYEPGNVRWATAREQANNRRPFLTCRAGLHELSGANVIQDNGTRRCKACRSESIDAHGGVIEGWSVRPRIVRAWAMAQGLRVSRRGYLSAEVVEAWDSAHPNQPFFRLLPAKPKGRAAA